MLFFEKGMSLVLFAIYIVKLPFCYYSIHFVLCLVSLVV